MNAAGKKCAAALACLMSVWVVTGAAKAGALIDAVRQGNRASVVSLLKTSPASVQEMDSDGRTPLHWAAEMENVQAARALLASGADVKARDGYGNTPLHVAARAGGAAVAQLLLAHGAEATVTAYNKYTPLHLAAWSGNAKIIKLLLAKGADVKAADYNSRTPLNYASTGKAVDLLVKAGAEVNATRMPPLLDVSMHGFPGAVGAGP